MSEVSKILWDDGVPPWEGTVADAHVTSNACYHTKFSRSKSNCLGPNIGKLGPGPMGWERG